jgi:hypothetical protein
MNDALKKKWTERTYAIYDATIAAAYGLKSRDCPEPTQPNDDESLLLQAREAFAQGRQCSGWDLVDRAMGCAGVMVTL